jgi:two-component system NtrC family sensor kinase
MRYVLLILFIVPMVLFSQNSNTFILRSDKISHSQTASGWIKLDSGWQIKKGDNPEWANPAFDDSSWQKIESLEKFVAATPPMANDITWLRLRIKNDSTFTQPLTMRLYLSGASELYIDGRLTHKFGVVSADNDSMRYYNPDRSNLSFPLKEGRTQVLALRFVVSPGRYPLYFTPPDFFLTMWVAQSDTAENDYITNYFLTFTERVNVVIGAAFILMALFLSFYIFFPAEKVNLYFSLSMVFFTLLLYYQLIAIANHGTYTSTVIPLIASGVCYTLLLLFCTYKIFNRQPGPTFWSIVSVGLLSIPAALLIHGGYLISVIIMLVLIDSIRISIKSIRAGSKGGTYIMLASFTINIIFWFVSLLADLRILVLPDLQAYTPFALLLAPLGLAIYLGYSFGKTSLSLQQKLTQVEMLSKEKHEILSTQNEKLEKEVQQRTADLNSSLENLKTTQSQLIQSEKMASLGELTAGIAHEIQNPLNFVNNFSEVSNELITEMNEELKKGNIGEAQIIAGDILQNLDKINHHGKRADAIVKGMLQHSRTSMSAKEPTDINKLADEYLRLAYHGLRAKDKLFNATLLTDYDETIGRINIIPQDIGRVILNLITNAFHSTYARSTASFASSAAIDAGSRTAKEAGGHDAAEVSPGMTSGSFDKASEPGAPGTVSEAGKFEPTVSLSTRKVGEMIEISVKDNGTGVPDKILDKIFQPFFTTKPTGKGTGLGLSLAYDIVKAHGGQLKVITKEGGGAEFIIQLPIQ